MLFLIVAIVVALLAFCLLRSLAGPIAIFVLIVLIYGWLHGPAYPATPDPCAGIGEAEIIATFNAHGFRAGGPSGDALAAVGATQFHASLANYIGVPGHADGPVAVCTGYLRVASARDASSATPHTLIPTRMIQVNVDRPSSDGPLHFSEVYDLR